MSIIISNMNMPTGCQKCKFFKKHAFGNGLDYSYSCILGAKDFPMPWIRQMEERASDCPIKTLENVLDEIRAGIDDWAYGLDFSWLFTQESKDKDDGESIASRFKCKAEQGGWCKRWERECVSYENCELSSYNFPCPGCVASSPLEREECDSCKWKDEKQKHYQS